MTADTASGMDETFSFRSVAPRRISPRRISRRAIKVAAVGGSLLLLVALFARWVNDSERASLARVLAESQAGQSVPPGTLDDARAQESALLALDLAKEMTSAGSSFADVRPGDLAATQGDASGGLTFTASPSTGPWIVSIASSQTDWAAAVRSDTGACYSLRLSEAGPVTFGTSVECTGTAALSAANPAW